MNMRALMGRGTGPEGCSASASAAPADPGLPFVTVLRSASGRLAAKRFTPEGVEAYAMARDAAVIASQIGLFFGRDHTTVLHGIVTAKQRVAG